MRRKCLIFLITMLAIAFSTAFSFAAADPAVTLVNPQTDVAIESDNILISIKVTAPKKLKISCVELRQTKNGESVPVRLSDIAGLENVDVSKLERASKMTAEDYECRTNLGFYTRKVENITPGLYEVRIKTIDAAGTTLYNEPYYVVVKEKSEDAEKIFNTPKSGTSQFLQNLLNKIFKS